MPKITKREKLKERQQQEKDVQLEKEIKLLKVKKPILGVKSRLTLGLIGNYTQLYFSPLHLGQSIVVL